MTTQKAMPKKWAAYYDQENILDEIMEGSVTLTLDEGLLQDIVSGKRKRKLKNISIKMDPLHVKAIKKLATMKSVAEEKTMPETIKYLEALVRETHKPEAEIVARAFQTGLRQLWREQILGRYLRGDINRDKAIDFAGIDWVELAERQHTAMMEDLAWALGN
jgi:hypothetical protein